MNTRYVNVRRNSGEPKRRILIILEGNSYRLKQLCIRLSVNLKLFFTYSR